MDRVDSMPPRLPPPAGSDREGEDAADVYAAAPLLNCLLREVAEPAGDRGTFRLRASGRLMRVRGTRRPRAPEVYADGAWQRLDHTALVELTAEELLLLTRLPNSELPAEMTDSRDTVAALLAARSVATPPADPYVRSEQSLITGHPYHPAPKTRGGGPAAGWLPYAPEAYARFPLELLGVREDTVVEEGDTTPLDVLGRAPDGYRLLPAHPGSSTWSARARRSGTPSPTAGWSAWAARRAHCGRRPPSARCTPPRTTSSSSSASTCASPTTSAGCGGTTC